MVFFAIAMAAWEGYLEILMAEAERLLVHGCWRKDMKCLGI